MKVPTAPSVPKYYPERLILPSSRNVRRFFDFTLMSKNILHYGTEGVFCKKVCNVVANH